MVNFLRTNCWYFFTRDMINCGMVVALGTDFNPNAHCLSMPMVMHLACVNLKMTLNEVRPKVADDKLLNSTPPPKKKEKKK